MIKRICILLSSVFPVIALAAGSGVPMQPVSVDLHDKPALQRGARTFVNYCLSCHSAQYQRYNRIAKDLSLSEDLVAQNLMFASDKVVEKMTIAMHPEDSARWFGVTPPDLSVVARSRGETWLYNYLISFYQDDNPARPFGVNNTVFPSVAMPNVLWSLQGIQKPVYEEVAGHDGASHEVFKGFEIVQAGTMSEGEFKRTVKDLVSFLVYMGEPAKLHRYNIGMWVLLFIAVFFVLARALYKEYWRDVH
jgi:ubiquinol-cytochrome c reductase cytochrome c1 subunit